MIDSQNIRIGEDCLADHFENFQLCSNLLAGQKSAMAKNKDIFQKSRGF